MPTHSSHTPSERSRTRRQLPKIFVPSVSETPLLHAVLTQDLALLNGLLAQQSPDDVLCVRDEIDRSVYHYAALSTSRRVKRLVFGHVSSHYDEALDTAIQNVMAKTPQLSAYVVCS